MRRSAKIKVAIARVPVRKATIATVSGVPVPRRAFPAWIDASDRGVAAPPVSVMPRVRDGLVLRVVRQPKPAHVRTSSHVSGAR